MDKNAAIYVAGHRGLAGSAIWKHFSAMGYTNLYGFSSSELDLTDKSKTKRVFEDCRPAVVIDAAALVGGIKANMQRPVDFLHTNLEIQLNLMDAAYSVGVERFLFLGSSCIYPRLANQPITEQELFQGPLESSNIGYAIAKITGVVQVQSFRRQYGVDWISAMPTNLYGENDNYDLESSHVLAALIRKFHQAQAQGLPVVHVWGTGRALREFMHADDLASACEFLLQNYNDDEPINVGSGAEIAIKDLADLIAEITGFEGEVVFDTSMPDGTPRKMLDSTKIHELGWRARWNLEDGIEDAYRSFLEKIER